MSDPTVVRGSQVQVGDHLVFAGRTHPVLAVEAYDATRVGVDDPGARIARSHGGWAMTIFTADQVQVVR